LNVYAYVRENPTNNLDPLGLEAASTGYVVASRVAGTAGVGSAVAGSGLALTTAAVALPLLAAAAWTDAGQEFITDNIAEPIGDWLFPETVPTCREADCAQALRLLKQRDRLAQKLGVRIDEERRKQLREKMNNGTITSNDLPGRLAREFPAQFRGMTLKKIEEACKNP